MGAALAPVAILARRSRGRPSGSTAGAIRVKGGQMATSTPPRLARRLGDRAELGEAGEAAVHLPVAGDELAAEVHGEIPQRVTKVAGRLARFYDPRKPTSSGPHMIAGFRKSLRSWATVGLCCSSRWSRSSSPASAPAASAGSAASAAARHPTGQHAGDGRRPAGHRQRGQRAQSTAKLQARAGSSPERSRWPSSSPRAPSKRRSTR